MQSRQYACMQLDGFFRFSIERENERLLSDPMAAPHGAHTNPIFSHNQSAIMSTSAATIAPPLHVLYSVVIYSYLVHA